MKIKGNISMRAPHIPTDMAGGGSRLTVTPFEFWMNLDVEFTDEEKEYMKNVTLECAKTK